MKTGIFALALVCSALLVNTANAANPPLADRHVARGLTCDKCHTDMTKPNTQLCLQCHQGVATLEKRNPIHAMLKDGKTQCTMCHKGHKN